jgi:hypothetical protein
MISTTTKDLADLSNQAYYPPEAIGNVKELTMTGDTQGSQTVIIVTG